MADIYNDADVWGVFMKFIFVLPIMMLLFAGCSIDEHEEMSSFNPLICIETYIFSAERIEIPNEDIIVDGLWSNENRIYYFSLSEKEMLVTSIFPDGGDVQHVHLPHPQGIGGKQVSRAFLLENGSTIFSGFSDYGYALYVLDVEGIAYTKIETVTPIMSITTLRDGRVVALALEIDGNIHTNVLREIDVEVGGWGDTISIMGGLPSPWFRHQTVRRMTF